MGIAEENVKDLTSVNLWKSVVAEILGTLFLVFFGCGTATNQQTAFLTFGLTSVNNETMPSRVPLPPSYVQISFAFGLSVATMVWCIAHVSGGHINPAVTVGALVARKISIVRAILYVIAQMLGAIAGAGILYGVTPDKDALGVNGLQGQVTAAQGFGVELMITFCLVFTVMASTDGNRDDLNGSAPLTIGLAVVLGHLLTIAYTGCSMNPARSFGPALIKNSWQDHWVFWLGPIAGGILAALVYTFVFAAPSAGSYDLKKDENDGLQQADEERVEIVNLEKSQEK
uniref:Aquaporin 4 n=1 Tax=Pinctada fucata TaxID=50426 RepID=A0A6G9ELK3_PINFU|nr:aquaporin 4 [Pinctada fucata]